MVSHLYIAIQQQVIIGLNLFQRTVISLGKTIVLIQENRLATLEFVVNQLHGIICRSIVSNVNDSFTT